MEELSVVPLSWADHYLVGFWGIRTLSPCRGLCVPIKMVNARRLMHRNGFLTALGEFPAVLPGNLVKELGRSLECGGGYSY